MPPRLVRDRSSVQLLWLPLVTEFGMPMLDSSAVGVGSLAKNCRNPNEGSVLGRGSVALEIALGMMPHCVIKQDERGHCLHHRDGSRENTGIMASSSPESRILEV